MKKTTVLLILLLCVSDGADARRWDYKYALDPTCPEEKPFKDFEECVGCNSYEALDIAIGHEKDFEICSNRKTIKDPVLHRSSSILKTCPPEAPIRNHLGSCIPCDFPYWLGVDKKECDKCPNRISINDPAYETSICDLKECPKDRPLKEKHECLSCDLLGMVLSVNQEMCEKCPDTYEWYHERCVPILANAEFGDNPLIDLEYSVMLDESLFDQYVTHDCNVSDPIFTTQKNCSQCPNREYKNGRCVLRQDIKQQNIHPRYGGLVTPIHWDEEKLETKK